MKNNCQFLIQGLLNLGFFFSQPKEQSTLFFQGIVSQVSVGLGADHYMFQLYRRHCVQGVHAGSHQGDFAIG